MCYSRVCLTFICTCRWFHFLELSFLLPFRQVILQEMVLFVVLLEKHHYFFTFSQGAPMFGTCPTVLVPRVSMNRPLALWHAPTFHVHCHPKCIFVQLSQGIWHYRGEEMHGMHASLGKIVTIPNSKMH